MMLSDGPVSFKQILLQGEGFSSEPIEVGRSPVTPAAVQRRDAGRSGLAYGHRKYKLYGRSAKLAFT